MRITEEEIIKVRKRAARQPNRKTNHYLCLVDSQNPEALKWTTEHGYPAPHANWGIFTENQNGYKWAKERIPYIGKRAV